MDEIINDFASYPYPDVAYNSSDANFANNPDGPGLTVSDYIEVVYNLTAMLIGVPINLWALHGHVKTLRSRPAHARLVHLGVHLTIANLMVLLIHSAGTVIWLLTYFWYGGDFLCRLFKCLSIMSFHISSNVVVSIAVDMFHSLHAPLRSQIKDGRKRVRVFLIISWILAGLLAVPQLVLWGEMDDVVFETTTKQCAFLFYKHVTFARMYNFAHLLCVFYIPLLFILFCYVGSAYHVWKHLRMQSNLIQHELDQRKHSIGSMMVMSAVQENNNYNCRRQSTASVLQQQQRRRSSNVERQTRTKMKLLRKSASVIGGYVLCWLPYQVFSVWQSFCDIECELRHYEIISTKLRWLEALMISCACINPFLYTFVRYRSSNNNSDSPRRGSHENQAAYTNSGHKRDSILTNGTTKRDSFFTINSNKRDSVFGVNGNGSGQHAHLMPLRQSSFGTPKKS